MTFNPLITYFTETPQPSRLRRAIVMLATPLIPIMAYGFYGSGFLWVKLTLYFWLLLVLFWTDMESYILPLPLTVGLGAIGLGWALLEGHLLTSLLGGIVGYSLLWGVRIIGQLIYKKESLGKGDLKLNAAIGLYWGSVHVLWSTYLAFVIGALICGVLLLLKRKSRHDMIPFGPFLIVGTGIVVIVMCLP